MTSYVYSLSISVVLGQFRSENIVNQLTHLTCSQEEARVTVRKVTAEIKQKETHFKDMEHLQLKLWKKYL